METLKQDIAPSRRVPAAKIQFLPEDRAWIAERIQEIVGGPVVAGLHSIAAANLDAAAPDEDALAVEVGIVGVDPERGEVTE